MRRTLFGFLTLGLFFGLTALANADRLPPVRAAAQKSTGTRVDISVPYLTTGNSALMGTTVAPKIYASPIVSDPGSNGAKKVYNLPFYGSKEAFGDKSNGATPAKLPGQP